MTRQTADDGRRYRFGRHEFDPRRGLLWRDGMLVPLTPKTADVLRVLVERRGDVVDKSELMRLVWPNTFVEENNLARHVSTLRKTLQERRGQHDVISTVPGHGYMFVAPVVEIEMPQEPAGLADAGPDRTGITNDGEPAEAVATGNTPAASNGAPGGRIRLRYVAAAVVVLAAVAASLIATVDRLARRERPVPDIRQLTFDGQLQRDPSWSPDGEAIVYANDRAGNLDLYRRSMLDPTPIRLTDDPADEWQAAWSPDGRWLAYRSEKDGGGIYVTPAAGGGPARRIADGGSDPRWSPDSSRLLVTDSTPVGIRGFRVVALDGGAPREMRPDVVGRFRWAFAGWHPDGRRISVAGRTADAPWEFVTVSVDGRDSVTSRLPAALVERFRDRNNRLGGFAWSRSGDRLYFEGHFDGADSIWQVNVDRDTLAWTVEPVRLYTSPGQYGALALSPDGRRLAFTVSQERTRVWRFPFDPVTATLTGEGRPVTSGGPGEFDAAAPLDGSKVAYRTVRGNRHELWQRSISGGSEHLVSSSSDWEPTSPRWSRDGTQLAYLRRLPQRPDVGQALAIHTAAGSERLLKLPGDSEVVPDDWSSDNAWLLAACRRAPGQQMGTCLVPVATTGDVAEMQIVAEDASRSLLCQRFSPDERWISFMAVDSKRRESTLYVMPATGGPWIQITDGRHYDDKPRWSPDGRAIYFLSGRNGAVNLWGQRFDGAAGRVVGEPFRVTSFSGAQPGLPRNLAKVEIAISSSHLFLPITEASGAIWMLDGLAR